MSSIQTEEYGLCLTEWQARQFLGRFRLAVRSERGALVFRYPAQDERKVLPVFIRGRGWFYALAELEREYVKGEPEVKDV